jgi:hypothetical protein
MHGWPPWAMTILTVLAWRQTRCAFGVQAQRSQRLFTVYLRQPHTFRFIRVFRGSLAFQHPLLPPRACPGLDPGGRARVGGGLSAQLIRIPSPR